MSASCVAGTLKSTVYKLPPSRRVLRRRSFKIMSNITCNSLINLKDAKDGGIPLALGINVGIALGICIVFAFMHCCFKDFIMAAVRSSKRWPPLLSRQVQDSINEAEEDSRRRRGSSFNFGRDYCESIMKFVLMSVTTLYTSEEGVRTRSGPDASLYLTMELYLLVMLCVFTVFSVGIILPINYLTGNLQTNYSFARTTISNLKGDNPALWSHVIFSILYMLIAAIFMLHYSLRLGKIQRQQSSHAVMINGVPYFVHVEDLMQHFEEALPGTQVVDIRFAYDIRRLVKKWEQLKKETLNLQIAESYEAENNKPLKVNHDGKMVDAKEYYSTKVDHLKVSVIMEKNNALNQKLSIAFVTFSNAVAAKMYLDSYKPCKTKPESSLSDSIGSNRWSISLSPYCKDLIWENLASNPVIWWLRWLIINLILIVFLIIFTTPPVLLNSSQDIWLLLQNLTGINTPSTAHQLSRNFSIPGFIQSYVSSFITWLLGYILLFLIVRSVYLEFHWSKSRRDQTILHKAFVFLLLQVLILPSLSLTSLNALGSLVVLKGEKDVYDQLSCVFLPNSGAYFINYIIILTFLSCPLELLRIPQLVEYLYRRITAKTKLEKAQISKKILRYDFMLGVEYAYNLLVFTVTVAFSLATPVIVPFGAVYFLIKYFVDKYNLLYAYRPVSASGRQYLHKSAMKLVLVGMVHLQFVTLFYSLIREGKVKPRSVIMMVTISVTCLIMFALLFLGWFSYLLPRIRLKMGKEYSIFGYDDDDENMIVQPGDYIAPVLQEISDELPDVPHATGMSGSQSYESFGRTIAGGKVRLSPGRDTDEVMTKKRPSLLEEEEIEVVSESNIDNSSELLLNNK